jgi:hypothetical protein
MGKKPAVDPTPWLTKEHLATLAGLGERFKALFPHLTEQEREKWRRITNPPVSPEVRAAIVELLQREPVAPPEPQEPPPKSRGRKSVLDDDEDERAKTTYRSMLAENSAWANDQEASAKRLLELVPFAKTVSWQTVKRRIVAPILKDLRSK